MRWLRRLAYPGVAVSLLFGGCLGGCIKSDDMRMTLDALQKANFKGHFAATGSPAIVVDFGTRIKVGADAVIAVDGYIDFSLPPGAGVTPPP